MTTTRISHTGHNHPSTTAARTACRKALKSTAPVSKPQPMAPALRVGNGKAVHLAVVDGNTVIGARCGSGLTRSGRDSDYKFLGHRYVADITCRGCAARYGQAHN